MPDNKPDKRKYIEIDTGDGQYERFVANPKERTFTESLSEKRRLGFKDAANAERLYQARRRAGYTD